MKFLPKLWFSEAKISSLGDFEKLDEASKKKLKVIRSLKLFFGLIVLGFCVWWLVGLGFAYWSLRDVRYQFEKPIPLRGASVPDKNANWTPYAYEEIEFQYPSSFTPKPPELTGSGGRVEFLNEVGESALEIDRFGNDNQVTGKPYASLEEICLPACRGEINKVIVAGVEAADMGSSVYFISPDGLWQYWVTVSSFKPPVIVNGKEINSDSDFLKEILLTFKFVDQSEAVDTSNWKTYTNNDCDPSFGISFKYPSNWQYFEPEKDSLTYTSCGVLFKPVGEDIDAPFAVNVLYVNDYQNHIRKLELIEKEQLTAQTPESVALVGLKGMHYKDSVGGSYSLNKDGKALEFTYTIIDSVDYGIDVARILSTLEFIEK